jgi:plastocyanin
LDHLINKYFQILGVSRYASLEETKQAYKDLAKVWHPDRFIENPRLQKKATEKLKEINVAYEELLVFYENKTVLTDTNNYPDVIQDESITEPYDTAPSGDPGGTAPESNRFSIWIPAFCAFVILIIIAIVYTGLKSKIYDSNSSPAVSIPDQIKSSGSDDTQSLTGKPADKGKPSAKRANNAGKKHLSAYFTLGSTTDDVLAIQGTPTLISGNRWSYGFSYVDFEAGRVVRWYNSKLDPLNVRMIPVKKSDTRKEYFTLGSTTDDVLAIQGTPTLISGNRWSYGFSYVDFEAGRVVRWYNSKLDPLNVKIVPFNEPEEEKEYFTLGSTADDVLAIQGTPTLISGNRWSYGFSYVDFEAGRVVRWYNSKHDPLMIEE